jgi:hypothetical protein
MWNTFIELSTLSMGVIPVLVVIFTVAFAVVIERLWFFHRVLSQGAAIERDLKGTGYRDLDGLRGVAGRFGGAMQSSLVTAGLESKATDAESAERHIDEAILAAVPVMDRNLWLLDTAVTVGPLSAFRWVGHQLHLTLDVALIWLMLGAAWLADDGTARFMLVAYAMLLGAVTYVFRPRDDRARPA